MQIVEAQPGTIFLDTIYTMERNLKAENVLPPYVLYVSPTQFQQIKQEIAPWTMVDDPTLAALPELRVSLTKIQVHSMEAAELDCQVEDPIDNMTLSDLIDRSLELRDEAKELERRKTALDDDRKRIDRRINDLMEAMGVDRTGNDNANVSRSVKKYANASDWDAFNEFILERGATYLLQRRISQKALEEEMSLLPEGETVPGISFYEESSISLRRR